MSPIWAVSESIRFQTSASKPKPKVADDLRQPIDLAAATVVSKLKRRCKRPKDSFNWPEDVFVDGGTH